MNLPERPVGHVFLCYGREDAVDVDRLQTSRQAAGIPVWRDTAALWPGEDWRDKIRQAITKDALAFVACFSTNSPMMGVSHRNEELSLAVEQLQMRPPAMPWLIPVRLDDCEIPDWPIGNGRSLRSLQRADIFGREAGSETVRLVGAVARILKVEMQPASPAVGQAVHADGKGRLRVRAYGRHWAFFKSGRSVNGRQPARLSARWSAVAGAVLMLAAALVFVIRLNNEGSNPVTIESTRYDPNSTDPETVAFQQQLSPQQVAAFDHYQFNYASYMSHTVQLGGAAVSDAQLQIVVRGKSDATSIVSDIRVFPHCSAPFRGTLLWSPGAAEDNNIQIGFNLDSPDPIAQYYKNGKIYGSFFASHTINLRPNEPNALTIHVLTGHHYCRFTLELVVSTASGNFSEMIMNHGQDFSVTASEVSMNDGIQYFGAYHEVYAGGIESNSADDAFRRVDPRAFQGRRHSGSHLREFRPAEDPCGHIVAANGPGSATSGSCGGYWFGSGIAEDK